MGKTKKKTRSQREERRPQQDIIENYYNYAKRTHRDKVIRLCMKYGYKMDSFKKRDDKLQKLILLGIKGGDAAADKIPLTLPLKIVKKGLNIVIPKEEIVEKLDKNIIKKIGRYIGKGIRKGGKKIKSHHKTVGSLAKHTGGTVDTLGKIIEDSCTKWDDDIEKINTLLHFKFGELRWKFIGVLEKIKRLNDRYTIGLDLRQCSEMYHMLDDLAEYQILRNQFDEQLKELVPVTEWLQNLNARWRVGEPHMEVLIKSICKKHVAFHPSKNCKGKCVQKEVKRGMVLEMGEKEEYDEAIKWFNDALINYELTLSKEKTMALEMKEISEL